jgi:hypothetical protein
MQTIDTPYFMQYLWNPYMECSYDKLNSFYNENVFKVLLNR